MNIMIMESEFSEFFHWAYPSYFPLQMDYEQGMGESEFWAWLDEHADGHSITDMEHFLRHKGFIIGFDRLSSKQARYLTEIYNHYFWFKLHCNQG